MKRVRMVATTVSFLLAAGTGQTLAAQVEKPRAPLAAWGVHAVVTLGSKTYEGVKVRAVLLYGEVGAPWLELEEIDVKEGWPDQSKVTWHTRVDAGGGLKDREMCPTTEQWCGELTDLRWDSDVLRWNLRVPGKAFRCEAIGVRQKAVKAICRPR